MRSKLLGLGSSWASGSFRIPPLSIAALGLALAAIALPGFDGALAQQGDWGGRQQLRGGGPRQGPGSAQERQRYEQLRKQQEQEPAPAQQQQQTVPGSAPMMRQETATSADDLLDQSLAANPARIEEARKKAAATPPSGADDSTLAQFYYDRGVEADIAGLPAQALEDLVKAAQHGEKAKITLLGTIYFQLAQLRQQRGQSLAAMRAVEKAIEYIPTQRRGRVIGYYGLLGRFASMVGDLPAAERALVQAQAAYDDVQRMFQSGRSNIMADQMIAWDAQVLCARGTVAGLQGAHAKAEDFNRKCIATAEKSTMFNGSPFAGNRRLEMSRLLAAQGRLDEAENEARLGLQLFQKLRGAGGPYTAQALAVLSFILGEQGRTDGAEKLARKAIDLMQASGLRAQGGIRMNLANALAAQSRWREAAAEVEIFRQNAGADPTVFNNVANRNPWLPIILIKTGKAPDAVKMLTDLVALRSKALGDNHYATAEARGQLGLALQQTGNREGARTAFQQSIPILLQRSRETDDDTGAAARDLRLRLIIEGYMRLLVDGGATQQAAAETFRLAEAARGRTVERALSASAARFAAANPKLAELARQEQDAQRQISALNSLVANAISARAEDQNADAIKALRAQIDGLRTARARFAEQIEKQFPDYAVLINPKPATIEVAQKALKPGEALISTYSAEDRTYSWAIPAQGQPVFTQWKIGRAALDKEVAVLRKALDPDAINGVGDIPAFDLAAAYRIYSGLLKPIEAGWGSAKSLVIIPHGSLAQLPFGILPTVQAQVASAPVPFQGYAGVPWLIRKAAIAQLPSVASLQTLRVLPASSSSRQPFVGFADPWFSPEQAAEAKRTQVAQVTTRGLKRRSAPKSTAEQAAEFRQLPRLPETADEVRGIALAMQADPSKALYIGADANKTKVKKADLSGYRVVMFATHGLVPGDITGLAQPALALAGPEVTPEADNGLLTMEEVLALKLDADWVVLSACNTASGQGAGSEAISGLGRAFFYAGTRALLVSNWPVETESARLLTTDLFKRQSQNRAITRAEALRQSMAALIDNPGAVDPATKKPAFSYAHPIFWAAFSLVGDGGV